MRWTFLFLALVCVSALCVSACGGDNSERPTDTSFGAPDTEDTTSGVDTDDSSSGASDSRDTTSVPRDGDETEVAGGFCPGGCAVGEICVFASTGDTEATCVDPRPGYWDDGTDPAKRLLSVADGWYRKRVDAWETENARCNDGSPYAYYFRKGSGDGVDRWLIYFKGGGSCSSEEECAMRWLTQNNLMTGLNDQFYPTRGDEGRDQGMYALEEPTNPFRSWNMVHLHYCSSDSFGGTLSPPDGPLGLWFRGQAVVLSTIRELLAGFDTSDLPLELPPMSDAELVVVSGASAGATAARAHMDRIASLIKTSNPDTVVEGLSDSALQPPIMPVQYAMADGSLAAFHGAEESGDVDCLAAHSDSPGLCDNGMHLVTGHGPADYYGESDEGHLGVAGPGETGAVDRLFVMMAQWDSKARSNSKLGSICVATECTSDEDCEPGEACLFGLCYRGEPCESAYCEPDDGLCWGPEHATACIAEIATLRHQCGANEDCSGGDICEQGLCVEPIYLGCNDTSECPDDYLCLKNLCTRSAQSARECLPGYSFVEDQKICEEVIGCDEDKVCGNGHSCVHYKFTPKGATFSWGIRDHLADPGPGVGVFAPDYTTHTAVLGAKFYTLTIDGASFAEALGEWLVESPAYRDRVAAPMSVPIPLFARAIETVGLGGLTSRTHDTGCDDDALFFVFCERSQDCDQPADALYALGVGDHGVTTVAGAALGRPGPLALTLLSNPACSDASLELGPGEFIALTYQRDGDVAHTYDLKVSLPPVTINGNQLPMTIYVGVDGTTYLDAELSGVAGGRLD